MVEYCRPSSLIAVGWIKELVKLRFLSIPLAIFVQVSCTHTLTGPAKSTGQTSSPEERPALTESGKKSQPRGGKSNNDVRDALHSALTLRAFDSSQQKVGQGSGFYIGEGRVITNAHVIAGADFIEFYDGDGRRVGSAPYASFIDRDNDLAVLPSPRLPVKALSVAREAPGVGDAVWAIGSPRGFEETLSEGIVSGFRSLDNRQLMQITAPISPGSSGGPVINSDGDVIGVVVGQVPQAQNLNFAVPLSLIQKAIDSPPGRLSFDIKSDEVEISDDEQEFRALLAKMIAGEPVNLGRTYKKSLSRGSNGDPLKASFFKLDVRSEQYLDIDVTSPYFDPYIMLFSKESMLNEGKEPWIAEDDDSGGGSAAKLSGRVKYAGVHYLVVRSVTDSGGPFELEIAGQPVGEPPAGRERWFRLGQSEGETIYLDRRSYRRKNDMATLWMKTEYASAEVGPESVGIFNVKVDRWQIDCSRGRIRLQESLFRLEGELLESFDLEAADVADWQSVVPESIGESMFDAACAR